MFHRQAIRQATTAIRYFPHKFKEHITGYIYAWAPNAADRGAGLNANANPRIGLARN